MCCFLLVLSIITWLNLFLISNINLNLLASIDYEDFILFNSILGRLFWKNEFIRIFYLLEYFHAMEGMKFIFLYKQGFHFYFIFYLILKNNFKNDK